MKNSSLFKKNEAGFLYLDALGGTTIVAIVILAVATILGSLTLQYRMARIESEALQIAISEMELGKYEAQAGMLSTSINKDISSGAGLWSDAFKVERRMTIESVGPKPLKRLQVKVYYDDQECITLWTYIWEGFS
ncbi:hypothetical protein [uncultured Veillonella sp.]|uniref:hypothetical protein n=1 Tax=uncultured Veillonella sp. TaxID=159268 RepID=UPI0025CCC318|nr:hypothetical protein [uncultured Veillonella sp.]